MSTTSLPTSPSPEPIDISTPPPPSESPPPLPQSPLPLLNRIRDGPSPLSLEERIGLDVEESPPLTEEQAMAIQEIVGTPICTREQIDALLTELVNRPHSLSFTTDSSGQGPQPNAYDNPQFVPPHFDIYECRLPNHHRYGQRIHLGEGLCRYPHFICFSHDYREHQHYVHARRRDADPTSCAYGWVLEAAPIPDEVPTPITIDDNDLSILHPHHSDFDSVNMALYAIDDRGLIADVDHHRGLEETHQVLLEEQKALDRKFSSWCDKWGAVRTRLIKARTRTHLHPYLEDEIKIPHPQDERPAHLRTPKFTITGANKLYWDEGVAWLPCPWYHYPDSLSTIPNTLFQPE
ncbi:hypothetical protein EI94DRAFT_1807943 [Lactarius quietus]|nr:hypothetical protein EI94DRAFT_1807943 [Lactarius quietus]